MIDAEKLIRRSGHLLQSRTWLHFTMGKRGALTCVWVGLSLVLLAACVPIPEEDPNLALAPEVAEVEEENALPPGVVPLERVNGAVVSQGSVEEEAAPSESTAPAILTVRRPRANIRSGPSIDFQIVGRAVEGDTFTTTGQTAEGWWRVCCIENEDSAEEETTQTAWMSQIVVTPDENAEALPTLIPLFPEDLAASWNVQYECGSRRCAVNECSAVSRTEIHNDRDLRWLAINRIVTWEEACGEDSTWPHQIDRIEGTERYPNSTGLFFFNYWLGPRPGIANALFHLESGEEIEVWCSDEQIAEVAEESGWTTVYNGLTCHDVRTGMLVSMQYTKRWFFTGEFEGDKYDRAYFGDFEVYKVKLDQTNALLAIVNARAAE